MKVDVTLGPAPRTMGGPKFTATDYDIYFTATEASQARGVLQAAGKQDYADLITPLNSTDPNKDSIWRGTIKDLQDCGLNAFAQEAQKQIQARVAAANAV